MSNGKGKDCLGDRMKAYEAVSQTYLTRRVPVILRLDMKAGHNFTKGFERPYDKVFACAMRDTMLELCKNIQGCVFGYTQSDEISLVLCDYQKLTTDAWFGYRVEKMVSVAAAMASVYFKEAFRLALILENSENEDFTSFYKAHRNSFQTKLAIFDCRAFNVPKEDVHNCILWRQMDATRNSIQGLAQTLFPHKELQGISCKALQDKMFTEKGVNWNDCPTCQKRGVSAIRGEYCWGIDFDMPILTEDHDYINCRINFED